MKDMLKKENVVILDSVKDWEDAIHVSIQPMVDQGYCTSKYIDAIIENTKKLGPYYVLCENFALIHANSEAGVLKKQLGVTLLRKPIKFKKDGVDVRILVALLAQDSESHMEAILAIGNIFSDPEKISSIVNATTSEKNYNIFMNAASV